MTENQIGTMVIEAAVTVHRELGPGLLETVYEVNRLKAGSLSIAVASLQVADDARNVYHHEDTEDGFCGWSTATEPRRSSE